MDFKILIDSYNNFINFFNSSSEDIGTMANILAIISISFSTLLFTVNKICFLYRLKTFDKTKRPKLVSEDEFDEYIHNYVKTKVIFSNNKKITIDKFIRKVIIKGKKQYHIILGETGSGKSTFLVNLYYRFNCRLFRHNYKIEYFPLKKSEIVFSYIEQIKEKEKTILLLDAFDEAFEANQDADAFLHTIENNTQYFAKIIITSRNNFFDTDDSVPNTLRINRVLKLKKEKYERYFIAPFSLFDVILYIFKKYKWHLIKQIKAFRIIRRCQEIMCRPVVLSYIELLIKNEKQYTNIFYIYDSIVSNWIQREAYFVWELGINEDDKIENLIKMLYCLINDITIYMYNHYPIQGDYYISISELRKFRNAKYLEKLHGKRDRSLFNRTNDKLFFAHKSILEFMLSVNFDRLNFRFDSGLTIFYKFLKESDRIHSSVKYSGIFQVNYIQIPGLMSTKPNGDLVVTSKNIDFVDMKHINEMILWHYNTFQLPVYINNKIYKRTSVDFLVNDIIISALDTEDEADPEYLFQIIEEEIHNCIDNHQKYEISIVTALTLRDP